MAGLTPPGATPQATPGPFSPLARRQYGALAWAQSRIFLNSLRTHRGGFELGARVLTGLLFFGISIGPSIGLGIGAWAAASHNSVAGMAVLLWILFLVWQLFAVFFPALAGQNPDLTLLLRFPVGLGSWIVLYLVYGIAAPSTLIGLLWTTAIGIGITVARPAEWAWTLLTLAVYALFNLLFSRALLAWIERWLAQRRTREILTGIFLLFAIAAQLLNPALHSFRHGTPMGSRKVVQVSGRIRDIQGLLPPGAATASLTGEMTHRSPDRGADRGLGRSPALAWLGFYTLLAGGLLALRLRSEMRGESFSEAPRPAAPQTRSRAAAGAWRPASALSLFSSPAAAVFEKELRYLLRSGPMLYQLAMPLVMVFVFGSTFRSDSFSGLRSHFALPIGILWAFLGLNRLACNNLGTEGQGLQFYFLSPTPLRTVLLGKNLFHFVLFLLEAAVISVLVLVRFGPPTRVVAVTTAAWLAFTIPAYFAAGNLISILLPFRMNMTRMRQDRSALGNGFVSLGAQTVLLGVGPLVFLPCAALGHPWLAAPLLLLLAGGSFFAYLRVLAGAGRLIDSRAESLTLEIAKIA